MRINSSGQRNLTAREPKKQPVYLREDFLRCFLLLREDLGTGAAGTLLVAVDNR